MSHFARSQADFGTGPSGRTGLQKGLFFLPPEARIQNSDEGLTALKPHWAKWLTKQEAMFLCSAPVHTTLNVLKQFLGTPWLHFLSQHAWGSHEDTREGKGHHRNPGQAQDREAWWAALLPAL